MRKSSRFAAGLLISIVVLLTGLSQCTRVLERFEETRSLMDTYVRVVIYTDAETALEAINAAFTRIEEVARIATTWESEGEAFKLNQSGYSDTPSDELMELLKLSLYYTELTD
jgi:thiamine biosynthesis lipoprotein ApbE